MRFKYVKVVNFGCKLVKDFSICGFLWFKNYIYIYINIDMAPPKTFILKVKKNEFSKSQSKKDITPHDSSLIGKHYTIHDKCFFKFNDLPMTYKIRYQKFQIHGEPSLSQTISLPNKFIHL